MNRKISILLLSFLLIISILPLTKVNATMFPDAFDDVFDKLNNFFNSNDKNTKMFVPEEEFLENEYLQFYFLEEENYLENPEAQQFYKDYLDINR